MFGNGKTALRGGYGLYFNTNNQQNLIVTVTNPPATPRATISESRRSRVRAVSNAVSPTTFGRSNGNSRIPACTFTTVNIQQTLFADIVMTVGYAGSRGMHLLRSADVNTAVAGSACRWLACSSPWSDRDGIRLLHD